VHRSGQGTHYVCYPAAVHRHPSGQGTHYVFNRRRFLFSESSIQNKQKISK
jgi:hypothetical protein